MSRCRAAVSGPEMRFLLTNTWGQDGAIEHLAGHDVRHFNPMRFLDRKALAPYPTTDRIVSLYRDGESSMKMMLTQFQSAIREFGAEGLVVHQSLFPPEWLVEHAGGLVRVLGCFDDPQKAYISTLPSAWAYHGAYYCSPSYSSTRRFADALAMFGVKHSHWFPLSCTIPTSELVTAVKSSWSERLLKAVYVGKCYGAKVDKLAQIDRGIGGRLEIYGKDWPLAGLAGFLAPLSGRSFLPKWIRPIENHKRRSIYLTSLIGLNMHLGSCEETGNTRMYEVAMHGALLLADKGGCDAHAEIFAPDVEAVYYGSVEEAIAKCQYYFRHPEQAINIAQRGFERARRDYSPSKALVDLLNWAASIPPPSVTAPNES